MVIRKLDEVPDEKTTLLRVTIPKRLLEEIRQTKKLCKERGFAFDIKPDVTRAIEKAIQEARQVIQGHEEPEKAP